MPPVVWKSFEYKLAQGKLRVEPRDNTPQTQLKQDSTNLQPPAVLLATEKLCGQP